MALFLAIKRKRLKVKIVVKKSSNLELKSFPLVEVLVGA